MNKLTLKFLVSVIVLLTIFSCSETSVEDNCHVTPEKEHATNPEIVKLKESMVAFRKSLSEELLNQGSACLNSQRFYLWHNTPANSRGKRDGITYGDLNDKQLKDFKSLMKLFLSTEGYQKVDEITVLSEAILHSFTIEFIIHTCG